MIIAIEYAIKNPKPTGILTNFGPDPAQIFRVIVTALLCSVLRAVSAAARPAILPTNCARLAVCPAKLARVQPAGAGGNL